MILRRECKQRRNQQRLVHHETRKHVVLQSIVGQEFLALEGWHSMNLAVYQSSSTCKSAQLSRIDSRRVALRRIARLGKRIQGHAARWSLELGTKMWAIAFNYRHRQVEHGEDFTEST